MNTSGSTPEDAEFDAELRRMGIVRKQGMAKEMMEEIAPLLAAEGIDVNDPNSNFDIDQLNEAMGRAIEQRNLALMTPVGLDRQQALAVLLDFAEALASDGPPAATAILDSINPEATAMRPAASHVIGAGLGLIDTWFDGGEYATQLMRMKLPTWRGVVKKIAIDLRVLGSRGSAFEAHGSIILRHGGEALMHGTMLLVAASILTVAKTERVSNAEANQLLQQSDSGRGSARGTMNGAAFGLGNPAGAPQATPGFDSGEHTETDELLLEAFEEWLTDTPTLQSELEVSHLVGLIAMARQWNLDIEDPEDFIDVIDLVHSFEDEDARDVALDVMHDYVHFQQQENMFSEDWEEPHRAIEAMTAGGDERFDLLSAVMEEVAELDMESVRASLAELPVAVGTKQLLVWIGASKPVTSTGGVKRADIAEVAAMIGVQALGVARVPWGSAHDEEYAGRAIEEAQYAQSMWQVPELSAWWRCLQTVGIIEVTPTRVKPGSAVIAGKHGAQLVDGELHWNDEQALERLCAVLVVELLAWNLDDDDYSQQRYWQEQQFYAATLRLIEGLDDDGFDAEPSIGEAKYVDDHELKMELMRSELLEYSVMNRAGLLAQFGLLERVGTRYVVPKQLRGVVVSGITLALDYLAGLQARE